MNAGGDADITAAESDDVMNTDAIRDTYVDTLNLWVGFSTAVLYACINDGDTSQCIGLMDYRAKGLWYWLVVR